MSQHAYVLEAVIRQDNGKGASRRLRREGLVPAIVYGGQGDPLSIALSQNELVRLGRFDAFYSQIINLKIEGQADQEVIVRAVQRHLYKPLYQHIDLQRVVRGQEMGATVSLHFVNEASNKGVKEHGAIIEHKINSVEIISLPRHLPETIEVDMASYTVGDVIHLRDLKLPEGVRLAHGEEYAETVVAQVVYPQKAAEESASEEA